MQTPESTAAGLCLQLLRQREGNTVFREHFRFKVLGQVAALVRNEKRRDQSQLFDLRLLKRK